MEEQIAVGIDIGTTSIKVCIVDARTSKVIDEISEPTAADIVHTSKASEQDVVKIVSTLHNCMLKLDKRLLLKTIGIGVSGQVHGIVFWNSKYRPWNFKTTDEGDTQCVIDKKKVSCLYTWQDGRCDTEFLSSLPRADSHLKSFTGYGCSTLFWISKHQPEILKDYNCAGTIADFVVCMICDLEKPLMSTQNAASWGYFNTDKCQWNFDILTSHEFPTYFLPPVVHPEEVAGSLKGSWCGIPAKIPVGTALGDLQCSAKATLTSIHDAFINVSTSAQLAFVTSDFNSDKSEDFPVEYVVPYFDRKYLVVAATLNGGNALATFVRSLHQWFHEIGIDVSTEKLWSRLLEIGGNIVDTDLNIMPLFLGERYAPDERASILNITPENFNLSQMFRAVCRGVIENIHVIMPREVLIDAGIRKIIGSGSALVRNKLLQKEVENCYKLPVVFTASADSATGAALSIISNLKIENT